MTKTVNFYGKGLSWFAALFFTAFFTFLDLSTNALAETPTPRLKPPAPALSNYLTESDARLFRKGLKSVDKRHWRDLQRDTDKIQDPVARDVLIWFRAVRDPRPPMDIMEYVTHNLGDYPRMTQVMAKAEARIFENIYDGKMSPSETLAWFDQFDPVSGEGRAALARAHYKLGNKNSGDIWLRKAWRESKLTRDRQRTVFGKYKSRLTAEDHAARADHLIWQGRSHYAKANALLPHMNRADRALMTVRLKLAQNSSGMDAAIKALPAKYRKDAGFLYERARWRRKKQTKEKALPIYLQIKTPPTNDKGKELLWREKKIMAYWAIMEKNWQDAYDLTRSHGASRGVVFAEAEFLGGWLALRKLGKADIAARHFETLRDGVTTPISLARALYWSGRAHEQMKDGQDRNFYAQAAQYPNTYYGQLASKRLSGKLSMVNLPPEFISDQAKLEFDSDRRVRAMHLLGEAGSERYFTQFAYHLDDEVSSQDKLSLLSQLAKDYGYMRPSLRAAKQAGRFQSMLTDSGYPTVASIQALPNKFNIPFVYAVARQESEFEPNVVSHAKAYGLMQMINSTARSTARKHKIPYSRTRLNSDGDYAANLGAHHLHDLLEMWDGSYILAAVSYNAGPHRAQRWIKQYGDPRKPDVDSIDWVEKIPFSETRNYVQRVMENMQVYRARLSNNQAVNQLDQDLDFGMPEYAP